MILISILMMVIVSQKLVDQNELYLLLFLLLFLKVCTKYTYFRGLMMAGHVAQSLFWGVHSYVHLCRTVGLLSIFMIQWIYLPTPS